ncbi:biotin transporter BioY [Gulosibacter bifidus]|uniref:Biotin transporter n=1 Tax=Gulosibacter bifidus TaxID=272239 RepID=A0ABW5RHA4_9MICO|nr:biotin transporter BioY [Gulosibacter bifidus]
MTSQTAVAPTQVQVLADALVMPRTWLHHATLIAAGAALVALLAQVEIPLQPVPITGQTLGVMLVGASLGAWRGAAAMLTYLLAGLAGLPVFAGFTGGPQSIAEPSFGFIVGFIGAAAFAGWCSQRKWDRRPMLSLLAFFGASCIPFLVGVPYMSYVLEHIVGVPMNVSLAMEYGVLPFIPGGIVKWIIAAAVLPLAWMGVRKLDRHHDVK